MKLMTIDSEGDVELVNQFSFPGTEFFSGIIENFIGNIPDPINHLAIIHNLFNSQFFKNYLNSHQTIENAIQTRIVNQFYITQNLDEQLVQELSELEVEIDGKLIKVVFNENSMFFITKGIVRSQDDQGNIIISEEMFWLEIGNADKGLLHLLIQHHNEFQDWKLYTVKQVVH